LNLWNKKMSHSKRTNVHAEKHRAAVGQSTQPAGEQAAGDAPTAAPEALVPAEPLTVTQEQLAELKEQAARASENWERLLRTTADFDNFKKRATREKQDAIKYANEALMQKLVPVLDNLDMALAAAQNAGAEHGQSLQTGVTMVLQQLKSVLAEAGLEEVNAIGQPFDPNFHEAISQQESPGVPEGQVLQQVRKGYKLRDRLLRPASVVVAKPPADAGGTSETPAPL
jgi:molecular chaperone GrpE